MPVLKLIDPHTVACFLLKKKKCDVIDSFCTLSFLKAGIELKMLYR